MSSPFYLVFLFAQMISARVGTLACVSQDDCTDGHTCHNGLCTQCLKCSLLLRKGSDCVADFNECGECLIGYERVLITDSSNAFKPCKPVRLEAKLNGHECPNDSACSPGYYCHEGSCVKCFDCSLLNRVSLVGGCPKLLSDCGSCMNGYEEVAVTMNTNLKLCERQTVTAVPEVRDMSVFGNVASICFFILILIGTVSGILIKRPKVKIITKSQCPELPSAPPLFTMDMPRHIKKLEEDQESDVTVTVDGTQQAKVFKEPDALYYHRRRETQDSDPDLGGGRAYDIPNLWTPYRSSDQEAEIGHLPRFFIHDYIELSAGVSVTDSPQQPDDVDRSLASVDELDDGQPRDFSLDDVVDSHNSQQEKNPSN